jgi:hypothetical protein
MDEAFHLVCHDCPEEGVYGDRRSAESALERHEREAGHRMSLLDISAARDGPRDIKSAT